MQLNRKKSSCNNLVLKVSYKVWFIWALSWFWLLFELYPSFFEMSKTQAYIESGVQHLWRLAGYIFTSFTSVTHYLIFFKTPIPKLRNCPTVFFCGQKRGWTLLNSPNFILYLTHTWYFQGFRNPLFLPPSLSLLNQVLVHRSGAWLSFCDISHF